MSMLMSSLPASTKLEEAAAYTVCTGGFATGTEINGWYQDGEYTPGMEYMSFTVSDVVVSIGSRWR